MVAGLAAVWHCALDLQAVQALAAAQPVLVEVVGALGDKSLIYRLKDVIERIAVLPAAKPNGFDPTQRVRAKAHLELARVGSRVAVRDLRDSSRADAAAATLRELGDVAVRPLIDALRDEAIRGRAHRLLRQITGERLPEDVDAWLDWWEATSRKVDEDPKALRAGQVRRATLVADSERVRRVLIGVMREYGALDG